MIEKKKLLVVEDEEKMRNGLYELLTDEGYAVETAEDGLKAVNRLKESPFDVVLADLKMPRLDGMGVLEKTRSISPQTVVIIITGYGTTDSAIEAMKLGAFDYVSKPFSNEQLTSIVERAVKTIEAAPPIPEIAHKVIAAKDIPSFVEHLLKSYTVVAPVAKGESHVFAKIELATETVLDYTSTILPLKKFLLPQEEQLLEFDRETGTALAAKVAFDPTILFGVHPCDMQGILRLDYAFTEDNPESNYILRRRQMSVVGVSCQPDDKCFCQALGTYNKTEGFDLFLTRIKKGYLIEVSTDRGAELLEGFNKLFDATSKVVEEAEKVNAEIAQPRTSLGCHVSVLPELFKITAEDKLWKELAEKCLSCGSCNLVCPTCYCFDVTDRLQLNLRDGARYRRWDSCQLESFAAVATGENFRENREDRLRHRFNRKYLYLSEKFGTTMCVGCGRCTRACLADINPVEVISKLSKSNELSLLSRVFAFSR